MLRRAFTALRLPYVRVTRFPGSAPSVLILRIDVDGAFGDRTRRLAEVAAAAGVRGSFFINGRNCEVNPGDLRALPGGHEIGHHGYVHNLFDDVGGNIDNLARGAEWVYRETGVRPTSFVAPRGLWNHALDAALAKEGYTYSSDFSIDFDSLPYRTPAGVLQVPVHPYSPERAAVFARKRGHSLTPTEVRSHYVDVLREQVRLRRPVHLYGHPEVLGTMASEVLPAVFEAAAAAGVPTRTLAEFAAWWSERETAGLRLCWNASARQFSTLGPGRVRGPLRRGRESVAF
jgi:peptidoglycan/xylan/chitin deacetylase (PgdA/CDA1 family)